ncbi:Ppx/GppA family phosphatase [Chitiniphilus purpureus]|uniref:Ppx/GppA family phosphatase n=1 Tax=Chitiniphilus purpureus TaxID=2981137 RepID=A0ABY6DRQ2_9NEIS|nr:Ppx/GppA phosphatase family protein [Chitiniphilus sp. CD1]UXY16388.1 Ppx/GppA family phosphatase [Chitiniphilus sp. CD1]
MSDNALIAAVDLGSNSFRLQVARTEQGRVVPLEALKETVRLAAGLDEQNCLTEQAQDEALAALGRFGRRLWGMDPARVRVVATNTFRVAKNTAEFLPRAQAALGFPIEIIGGHEEARLIYLGAAHSLTASPKKRLVVDIGGGSTELIIGRQYESLVTESTLMGCVSWSRRFFADGRLGAQALAQAESAARHVLQPFEAAFAAGRWQVAIGTSGTARSLADILLQNGFAQGGITSAGLLQLRERLLQAGHIDQVRLLGLRADRKPVLAGGFAIMAAVFAAFGIEQMQITYGALRDGVLHDLVERRAGGGMRDRTIAAFARRYRVDVPQAEQVAALALQLFGPAAGDTRLVRSLHDAALLHEVGRNISHISFHKHSAYLLRHADMPGFSRQEQAELALLALAQQGRLHKLLAEELSDAQWRAVLALRLAVLVYRARQALALPGLSLIEDQAGHYRLQVPAAWLDAHHLIRFALDEEARAWQKVGKTLLIPHA